MKMFLFVFFVAVFVLGGVMSRCHDYQNCWEQLSFPLPVGLCSDTQLCNCSIVTVDCSHSKLQFVPLLPHGPNSYLNLNFSHNNLSSISDINFFANVSREVQSIDLSHNNLRFVVEEVFQGLDNLTTLLLYSNHLGYQDLQSVLNVPSLHILKLGCSHLGPIPFNTFQDLSHSRLMYLDLKFNKLGLGSLNLSAFQPFRELNTIRLWHNDIYELQTAYFPSWKHLILDTNRLYSFPRTCSSSGESLFPNLKNLSLDQNMIWCIDSRVCLPNLAELSLNFNNFRYFTTDTFSTTFFPAVLFLEIMQMENKIFDMYPLFINNSVVTHINFMLNGVNFNTVSDAVFDGCTSVEHLSLEGNVFQGISEDRFHRLLRSMEESLLVLSLAKTQLTHVSRTMFTRLRNLNYLKRYHNCLVSVPDGAFDSLLRLKQLDLTRNRIETLSQCTFGIELRQRLKAVYLSGNPFQCSCGILWFQQWMKEDYVIFKDYHTPQSYLCANVNNVSIPSFVLNPQACLLGSDTTAFTIAIACVLIFFLILFTICFRFRWHFRLWVYEVCRSARRHRRFPRGRPRLRFDVFVSYAEEDAQWVLDELLPVLEDDWGLTLCVHQRDFVPGKHIVDNISDCVSDSERVLLVFSPDFARSEWCQFELRYCQSYVMERDDVMVLLALRETETRDMTGAMLAVLRSTTYLEWDDAPDARQAFWGRLRLALEDFAESRAM